MKFIAVRPLFTGIERRSREGAWIEIILHRRPPPGLRVAPARERGLKCLYARCLLAITCCRSREGAWIEISPACSRPLTDGVAPARERGLKSLRCTLIA